MKRTASIILVSLLTVIINGCGDKTIDSQWTDRKISVDGIAADWQNFKLQNYDKQDLFMGVTNDDDNLYILVSFKGQNLTRRFSLSGLTVWFDGEGKKKKETGVKLVPEMNERRKSAENRRTVKSEEMRKELEERRMNLIRGLTVTTNGGVFYRLDSGGNLPRGAYTNENGAVNIEFAIPLSRSSITPFAIGSLSGSKVRIGFDVGGSQDNMRRASLTSAMGGRSGGMGGGRGGMGGMSGGTGRQSQYSQFQDIWLNVNLASENPNK